MAMKLQAPTRHHGVSSFPTASSLATIGNAGLRRPFDRFALKSSFFCPSLNLLLSPQQRPPASAAPRFSMRVASKQAYICRDCGYPFLLSFSPSFLWFRLGQNVKWLNHIAIFVYSGIFTMRELPLKNYLISTSVLVNPLHPYSWL